LRKRQRLKIFQSFLETILFEGGRNNLLIFTDPNSEKCIQFAAAKGDKLLIIYLPKASFNKEETQRLIDRFRPLIEEFEESWKAEISIQQGPLIAESIFHDIFLLSDDYSFETEITLR